MKDETINETEKLIETFKNPEIIDTVEGAKLLDPVQQMRKDMMSFFTGRIESIQENKEFKDKVKDALLERIEKKDVSFSDLKSLFSMLYEQGTLENESVLSLLRPAGPNSTNPLLSAVLSRKDEDGADENIKPEDLPKLDKLYRLLQLAEQEDLKNKK
jgi:hypothetical protein